MGMSAPGGPVSDAELNAYIETMMLLAIADGMVKEVELHVVQMAVVAYLENHPTIGTMTRQALVDLCYASAQKIYDDGAPYRLKLAAAALDSHEKRMYALGMAVAVSTSDGFIHPTERDALKLIQRAFELSDDEVRKAVESFK